MSFGSTRHGVGREKRAVSFAAGWTGQAQAQSARNALLVVDGSNRNYALRALAAALPALKMEAFP